MRTLKLACAMHPINRAALSPPSSSCSITRVPLIQEQVNSATDQDTLLHGTTSFAIPTLDWDHTTPPLVTQSISSYSCDHALLTESMKSAFIIHFREFLTAGGWEEDIQLNLGPGNYLGSATKKSKKQL